MLVCVLPTLHMWAGGWQSNHCRATAAAARELGIECHLILRTDYTPENIPITGRRSSHQLQ
jgi:1-aminocyclopropane-1-carboxylate deaminase/D-cysteine desulfhydrase-like pyridoxal-dependent ACC family enzyme